MKQRHQAPENFLSLSQASLLLCLYPRIRLVQGAPKVLCSLACDLLYGGNAVGTVHHIALQNGPVVRVVVVCEEPLVGHGAGQSIPPGFAHKGAIVTLPSSLQCIFKAALRPCEVVAGQQMLCLVLQQRGFPQRIPFAGLGFGQQRFHPRLYVFGAMAFFCIEVSIEL